MAIRVATCVEEKIPAEPPVLPFFFSLLLLVRGVTTGVAVQYFTQWPCQSDQIWLTDH
jgi:hypothetical protein